MMTRRKFICQAAALGAGGLVPPAIATEPPPETRRIRLMQIGGVCVAPQYVAEELLPAEGFTDVQYVKAPGPSAIYPNLASGAVDISIGFIAPFVVQVESGGPIVMLAGVHPGCFELFAVEGIRAIKDLKGRTISVPEQDGAHQLFLSVILAHVGLNPKRDVNWLVHPARESIELLAQRKIDALIAFAPVPQEMRAKKIGHVIFNSALDRPWTNYFCCVIGGNREFVKKHPVATKRAIRALIKGSGVCASDPEGTAKFLVKRGFTANYDYAAQAMRELNYTRWADYSAEDSVRFFALRLQEAGYIKSPPQKIIAQGTDWRIVNQLRRELKS